jgi:hypothetical protein
MNFGTPCLDRVLKLSPGPDSAPFSPRHIRLSANSRIVLGLEEFPPASAGREQALMKSSSNGLFTAASLSPKHAEIWIQDSGCHFQVSPYALPGRSIPPCNIIYIPSSRYTSAIHNPQLERTSTALSSARTHHYSKVATLSYVHPPIFKFVASSLIGERN